jgi:hypothetical protein
VALPSGLTLPWRSRLAAWAIVAFVALSCVAAPPRRFDVPKATLPLAPPRPEKIEVEVAAAGRTSAVVLVVLDGVRWQEVFEGVDPALARAQDFPPEDVVDARHLMPTLHDVFIAHGVAVGAPGYGPEMRATGPNYVSLPGYNEILSGRTATRCLDNECPARREPTFADELSRLDLDRPRDAAVISSWESIERAASAGGSDVVISTGRHHGRNLDAMRSDDAERALLEQGMRAGSAPGSGDFRPDRFTAEIALRYLERETPRFLFLGLGEPDEYAHQGNYRGYLASLRAADDALGRLVDTLGRMGERGKRTSVFVTTDHGRASTFRDHGGYAPESGRVWLVASGGGIPETGPVRSFEPHRLADIAPTMRALMGLAADDGDAAGKAIAGIVP